MSQIAHASDQSQLLRLTGGQQPLVEVPDDVPFAPHGAAVAVEGSHAHQCGDLTTVKGAQLGQVGQQREGEFSQ